MPDAMVQVVVQVVAAGGVIAMIGFAGSLVRKVFS